MNAVYIMASRKHGTLYIGVTSELLNRVAQHREGLLDGFTKRFGVKRLVWFEAHDGIAGAIQREKSVKKYRREWKINLIERDNPNWDDLYPSFFVEQGPLSELQPRELPKCSSWPGLSRPPMNTDGNWGAWRRSCVPANAGVHRWPGQARP